MQNETLHITTPSDREIVLVRRFEAPRNLVFDALTKPELLKRWLTGPPGFRMVVCEIDLKVGGAYRYVWRGPNGEEMPLRGVYREIVPPERLVCAEQFDNLWYPRESVGTTVLTEQDGRTTLAQTFLYASREIRDGLLKTNAMHSVAENYAVLEKLLAASI